MKGGYYMFAVVVLCWALFTFMAVSPSIQVALRVVPFKQRTAAFGLQVMFFAAPCKLLMSNFMSCYYLFLLFLCCFM